MRVTLFAVFACVAFFAAAAEPPTLFREPALSRTHIVFHYAGDLWIVGREGGEARRLTTGPGRESNPYFSPDGRWVAFTGEYDGNVDVYVVPVTGGVPRRLTWHPGPDEVAGWTTDGKAVLFRSPRNSYSRFRRLFTIALDGSFPEQVPLVMAEEGSFSPDGTRIAYVPLARAFTTWKRYRGGRTTPIWIARLADSEILDRIPRDNSNEFCPMWIADRIYFLSDRNGPVTLYYYDLRTRKVVQAVANSGFDFKHASAGPDAIVLEQFGAIYLFDLMTQKLRPVRITLNGDLPELRPRWQR
ncbi:MAG: protease, partial [Bryobacteraceae bacterium]